MRPTLRLVIGSLCVVVVIAVATVTLAITYTVSLETVRDVGSQFAGSLAQNARDKTEEYFANPARHMDTMADLAAAGDFNLPSLLPDQRDDVSKRFILDVMFTQGHSVNHTYTTYAIIFDDGSSCSVVKYDNDTTVGVQCNYVFQHPSGPMSVYVEKRWRSNATYVTGQRSTSVDLIYPFDARVSAYDTAKILFGSSRNGIWLPVAVFYVQTGYEFLVPALKPVYNVSGSFIGMLTGAVNILTVSRYLQSVRGTPNTEAFALQADGFLIGSTHSSSFYRLERLSPSAPVPQGCTRAEASDFDDPIAEIQQTIGCRSRASELPYAPLQAVAGDRAFLNTPTTAVKRVKADNEQFFIASAGVPNHFRLFEVNIVLCMPEVDVLGDIVRSRDLAIGVTAAVAIVVAAIAFGLVYVLLQPLTDVSKQMLATARLRQTEDARQYSNLAEIKDLQKAYSDMNTAIGSFTRYVPRDVVKDLMASGQLCAIRMSPLPCSMLFVDIQSFTSICERVPPNVLSNIVSMYFDRASRIVMAHDGLIDKFIGDCIMAVWGAPFGVANQEVKATLAALLLNRETMVEPLSKAWDDEGELLRVRVGVSSGEVLAGNMGSEERMNYTVIGDAVNLAARLESMNKQFDTRVLVSEATAASLGHVFVLRLLMPIAVVGKEQPVRVFEVMGLTAALSVEDAARLDDADRDASHTGTVDDDRMSVLSSMSAQYRDANELDMPRFRKVTKAASAMVREAAAASAGTSFSLVCAEAEVDFAAKHSAAVMAYIKGDFGRAIEDLDRLLESEFIRDTSDVGKGVHVPRSVTVVRDLSEKYLREGAPSDFNGVYRALEK